MTSQNKPGGEPEVSKKAPQSGQDEIQQRQAAERKAEQAQRQQFDEQNRAHSRNRVSDKDADAGKGRKS